MNAPAIENTVWVIGGGSGIGRATALRLAAAGRRVAISGRRADALHETVALAAGHDIRAYQLDATDSEALAATHTEIQSDLGPVGTLVLAAGTNLGAQRWWETLDASAFRGIMDVNLTSAVDAVATTLPAMRENGGGRIFVVGSWAGWRYMSVAGVTYTASKLGLAALVESLNDQEGRNGIRATLVVPGEVNTEILKTRPVPPSDEEIAALIDADDIARMIQNVSDMPFHVCVNELVISGVLNGIYLRDTKYSGAVAVTPR
ncbi:SDR family oxidoreductase [Microbacterium sp. NPDC089696]|uniref:SDR family oxidoreductase n=1 Tax=Microbacterium sp. NPDC089696 TaxID=3364199 RepID=UPI0037FFE079